MSPGNRVTAGTVFVALKCYFDGSQTDHRLVVLASVSGEESVWAEVETAWASTLKKHGAAYMHMVEAMPLVGEFSGWKGPERDALIYELVSTLERYRSHPRFLMFSCSVDLKAHRKWAVIRKHPSPERLCARIVLPTIVHEYPGVIDVMDLWFDQNERFMTHVREDWENKKVRRREPVWTLIRTIAPADMRITIPIQVADMFAWSRNRLGPDNSLKPKWPFDVLAFRITHSLHGHHTEVGPKAMAESTFHEEGLRRERLFTPKRRV